MAVRQARLVLCPGPLVRIMGAKRAWSARGAASPSSSRAHAAEARAAQHAWTTTGCRLAPSTCRPVAAPELAASAVPGDRRGGVSATRLWSPQRPHTTRPADRAWPWRGAPEPVGQRARMLQHTGVLRQQRRPTEGGRRPVRRAGRPGGHRPPHGSALPRPARGVRTATPVDIGARVGRVVPDRWEGCLGRLAPEHWPRMEAAVLAPWEQHPGIAAAAPPWLATAAAGQPGAAAVERGW